MKVIVVALLMLGSSFAMRLISSDELHQLFLRYGRNEASDNDLKALQDVLDIYRSASNAVQRVDRSGESITCLICRTAMSAVYDLLRDGVTEETIISGGTIMCASLGIVRPNSCRGIMELNVPIFKYIIETTPEATPRTFCALVLQKADDPNYCKIHDSRFDWTVKLPERQRVKKVKVTNVRTTPLTVALITDAHIDPLYEPNGVADCNEPTCCRKGQLPRIQTSVAEDYVTEESLMEDNVIEKNGDYMLDLDIANGVRNRKKLVRANERDTSPAGFWGDYRNCDSPYWAYDDVIERISSAHRNVDVVYYMGDSIDHHVWETTYEQINEINGYIIDKMREEFGEKVPIIPTIGNHESQPTNQFAPVTVKGDKLNTTWLYESLAKKWDFYLTENAKASLRKMGAFSMLVQPGLRVISINTNVAYKFNWWLAYDPLDAKGHLDWLIAELYKAELAGEKVHILAHMPPGVHDLTHTWTREYNRIVNRFSATIGGEFNGHVHSDEFKIYYSKDDGSPISMAWGAGSATTYSNYNLNYKIATFDPTTYEPLNIVNYVYNLTEANLTPLERPRWFQLYDIKKTFGVTDISPRSMDKLVRDMVTGKLFLLDMYAQFSSKLSDTRSPYCDDNCKIDKLCNTVVTVLWEREKCNELRRLFFS